MAMSIIFDMDEIQGSVEIIDGSSSSVLAPFLNEITVLALESAMAVLPIMLIFLICNFISIRVEAGELGRICTGLVYNWAGLTLFLTGVNAGFLDAGRFIGHTLAENHGGWLLILIGFVIGLVTILAEPAVHVLTHQIESVTSGYVKRSYVLGALSIGVGCAVALSIIRILIPELQLWHYLLPGYAVALALNVFRAEAVRRHRLRLRWSCFGADDGDLHTYIHARRGRVDRRCRRARRRVRCDLHGRADADNSTAGAGPAL